jgi:oxygen-independent coproporphyrinogen-3 oxidase
VYLHVPFCRHLCFYCGCHTRAERNDHVIRAYAETLCAEIGMVAGHLQGMPLTHLHWGGGTPTDLGSGGLARVLRALSDAFHFDADLEHAIELDPRRLDRDLVRSLVQLGVNRASLGVQTFDPVVQATIGRVQPYKQVARAVDHIRRDGIEAISFDLMYGLPHQTEASVIETAIRAAGLGPRRLSVFGYAHVPWMKKVQGGIDVEILPGPEERLMQMTAIRDVLVEAGYVPVGFDHFAAPDDPLARSAVRGRLRRNFQGYTTDTAPALIGFGASAISRLPAGYAQNTADLRGYAAAVLEGLLPTARGWVLTQEDRQRAALIEALLCGGFVHLDSEVPETIRRSAVDCLERLVRQGLVALEGERLRLTEVGQPFARVVASTFDAYLPDKRDRHSLAV